MSARLWRLWHEDLEGEPGRIVELDGEESHHVLRVLRLRPGDALALFDGRGREWKGTLLDRLEPTTASVRLEAPILEPAVEPALAVTLYQSLLRADRMDWVVQKATEVGVAALCAVETERSEKLRATRVERWRRIAVESCKQSGRRVVPALTVATGLPGAPQAVEAWILEPSAAEPMGASLVGAPPAGLWLASGPESGFTPAELDRARVAGWKPVSVGPRVLRADTAGVIGLALALHRWADLGARPPAH